MNIYNLEYKKPNGEIIQFSDFEGKLILIVNTATKCGLSPQFKGLEELHKKHKNNGLVIIGFPSNQFLNQEPETNETMEQSCKINFGVSFQLTEKVDVNGKNTHPVFKYLKNELGSIWGGKIKWNFTKFLIDKNGKPYKRYSPTTKPDIIDKDIINLLSH
ncbi:MAG: glutathione peroxidase [Bacteroidetes bacterium]|jgi:glutathione peroxidase|nr:glutathione peroxidase [Bacteroidota bacterium]MBT5529052.1 glutathione peroxidase [Cytophagia bacterium]MBT3423038.1 glutathione peroxidase [Bacteroidota bacterium]MBT3802751.1 glutathione peroxidase [Bacteroidota bacterium]MBT3934755.1 glutathione peroxidase [Bacteroidota bacterium]